MAKQLSEKEYAGMDEETKSFLAIMAEIPKKERLILKGYVFGLMSVRESNYQTDDKKAV